MLRGMTSIQFAEWQIMFGEWNLGDDPNYRADLRMGIATSTAVNIAKAGKGSASKPDEFMPNFVQVTERTQEEKNRELFKAFSSIAVKKKKTKDAPAK